MYILIFFSIITIFIFVCLEYDRNKRPKISFIDYYNFKSCLIGFLNTLIFFYDNQMIFDEKDLKIHRKFKTNYDKILNEINDVYNKYTLINPGVFDDAFKEKKVIPEHRGPFKGLLRYHFTVLSEESSKNFLKVKDKYLFWREKEGFCFDDTFYHKAKKKTNGLRVVIICDLKRKLPLILDIYNKFCLRILRTSDYVKTIQKQLKLRKKKKIKVL